MAKLKIEILRHKNGNHSFRTTKKGRIIVHSEGYSNLENCKRALEAFLEDVSDTTILSIDVEKLNVLQA